MTNTPNEPIDNEWATPLHNADTYTPTDPNSRIPTRTDRMTTRFKRSYAVIAISTLTLALIAAIALTVYNANNKPTKTNTAPTTSTTERIVGEKEFAKAAADQRLAAILLKAAEQIDMVHTITGTYPKKLPMLGAQTIGDTKNATYITTTTGYCVAVWDPVATYDSPTNALGYTSGDPAATPATDTTTMCADTPITEPEN